MNDLLTPEPEDSGLPSSLHAEVAILGAMLLDSLAIADATAKLRAEDFTLDSHRRIYRVMLDIVAGGYPVDFLIVQEGLTRRRELATIGGPAYLAYLTEGIPRNLNIESYVRIVREKSLLREAHGVFTEGSERCIAAVDDAQLIVSDVAMELNRIAADIKPTRSLQEQSNAEWESIERQRRGDTTAFITSGLATLDDSHGGFAIGEMTLLAARPNVGKSSLLRQGVIANCSAGKFVHLFSPEMDSGRVLRCLWAAVAQIPYSTVRHPERMSEQQRQLLRVAKEGIAKWPLLIDETPSITPIEIVTRARRARLSEGTQLVGIDYIQQLEIPGGPQYRAQGISAAGRMFVDLAKEGIAVVAVSALTEEDGKKGGIPTMHHLRGSGDLKYQADSVYLLHRDLDAETQKLQPETLLIAGKARGDVTGSQKIYFNGPMQTFETSEQFQQRMR